MKKITLTNSTENAIVDDWDYDMVSQHKWYLEGNHAYAHVMVPIEDPGPFHESYALKVRMDRFIYGITASNNIVIRHMDGRRLDYRRDMMFPYEKAAKRGQTRYLGVKRQTKWFVAEYRDRKGKVIEYVEERIPSRTTPEAEIRAVERKLAEKYDEWARKYEGPEAKTNFLPKSIYRRKS